MHSARLIAALAAAAALAACDPGRDREEEAAPANAAVSAEGKAEEGKIAIKAPGFDLAIAMPKEVAEEARADRDSKLLYPGAVIRGMLVTAGPAEAKGAGSEVDMRISTPDPVERVAAWYRDPARAEGFRLEKASREGEAQVITGVQKHDRHPFKLRLTPRPGGGTDGRLTVTHKG